MTKLVTQTIRLHRKQAEFRRSDRIYRGFVGGRGAGKSWVGAYDLIRRAKPARTYLIASPTYTVLDDTTFPTFKALAQDLGVWLHAKMTPRPNVTLVNGATVRFRSAEDPEMMRGPNLSGAWLDEASLMVRGAFDICIASLREGGEQGWLSATFTPKGVNHWTYEIFGAVRPDTAVFHAKTADNPFNPSTFAETLGRIYTGAFAAQELGGEWVNEDDSFQVIPESWIRAAAARWKPDGYGEQPLDAVGCDIAHGGADQTVLAPRRRHWFAPLLVYTGLQTPDGPTAAQKIAEAIRGFPKAMVMIDSIGYGASAFEFAVQRGMNAYGINFGCGTTARDRTGMLGFRNLRAFAYWSFRELLDPANGADVALPPDRELFAELAAPRWSSDGGLIQIEPKAKIKDRLGRSPDRADAVVLSILLPPTITDFLN